MIGQNAVKIFKKCVGMSIQYLANLTAEERIFVRQFKLSVLGENDKLPSILLDDEDDLVLANKAKLSIELDINRSKLYMRGNFETKEKPNFHFDNPTRRHIRHSGAAGTQHTDGIIGRFVTGGNLVDFLCSQDGYNCPLASKNDTRGYHLHQRSDKYYQPTANSIGLSSIFIISYNNSGKLGYQQHLLKLFP